jgi:peptidoglycan/LPS O-acetylase OafA/YrhL
VAIEILLPSDLVSIFLMAIGLLIIGMWTALLLGKKVEDLETDRLGMIYHILVEFITGMLLVLAGVSSILDARWSHEVSLVALGMLLYTIINSSGYYAQKGDKAMVFMFAFLGVLTVIAIASLIV